MINIFFNTCFFQNIFVNKSLLTFEDKLHALR